jgi:hypothetical protein
LDLPQSHNPFTVIFWNHLIAIKQPLLCWVSELLSIPPPFLPRNEEDSLPQGAAAELNSAQGNFCNAQKMPAQLLAWALAPLAATEPRQEADSLTTRRRRRRSKKGLCTEF